jgi:hypothetical protein
MMALSGQPDRDAISILSHPGNGATEATWS